MQRDRWWQRRSGLESASWKTGRNKVFRRKKMQKIAHGVISTCPESRNIPDFIRIFTAIFVAKLIASKKNKKYPPLQHTTGRPHWNTPLLAPLHGRFLVSFLPYFGRIGDAVPRVFLSKVRYSGRSKSVGYRCKLGFRKGHFSVHLYLGVELETCRLT